jgi:hypothetical protein
MYFVSNVIVHIIVMKDSLLQFEPSINLLPYNPPFIFGRYTAKNAAHKLLYGPYKHMLDLSVAG